ncbi:hypothetical protein N658DRAFT_493816 [Parathielavia hyrcaniae]|uniref:F-box domain-containing protein n=1 Tax=Parathielavia hyrcaniae TaxID=113614 RepID=A0AAN6Q8T6_9PEZI|nr:hypothetical protein N658DRAFT_493816 [Parathielavia hyrcaniae]
MAGNGEPGPDSRQRVLKGDWEAAMKAAVGEAKSLTSARQFSKALHVAMAAVNMCACDPAGNGKARHPKDKSCNISQCVAAVKSKDANALFDVTKVPCVCGYVWPSCSHELHLVALDALAECLEKAEQYVSAFSTALSMVRLDPTSAMGYCRGAKVLQYLLKNCSQQANSAADRFMLVIFRGNTKQPSALRLRRLLERFVDRALHTTGRHRQRPKDSYDVVLQRMAYNLKIEVARRDPAKEFPPEVLGMIFLQLSTSDVNRCLRVNKHWSQLILRDTVLWTHLRLGRPGNPGRSFPTFLQKHPEIRSLVIRDASDFQLTGQKLCNILHGLPHLKRLCLDSGKRAPGRQPVEFDPQGKPEVLAARNRLTHLSIVSYDILAPVVGLIKLNMESLEVLDLVNTGAAVENAFRAGVLPSLRRLRILNEKDRRPLIWGGTALLMTPLEVGRIVLATPKLEQFHLSGFSVLWSSQHDDPAPDKAGLWPSLRHLVLGPRLEYSASAGAALFTSRILPPLTSELRSVELLGHSPEIAHNVLFTVESPAATAADFWDAPAHAQQTTHLHLPNLEVFRCIAGVVNARLLRAVLEPAAAAGNLQVLELGGAATMMMGPDGSTTTMRGDDLVPARDLAFAASDALHTLGLHDFNFYHDPTSRFGASSRFDGQPFLDWLECFPRLHTVGVYPGEWSGVAAFVEKLIVHPRVRVVHQECLRGVAWDEALRLARKHGVALLHSPGHMSSGVLLHEGWEGE